ncbi:hypothetical protein JRQ81_012839 [Phrynocephalus forsythii]|uniref:Uncharacterized protein n=1 Tax=Phrynocephalus forsythii TaxID=171643 RepID=A0A9Q0Y2Z1_9SAUR|nr:hypothetical protein JRQ81_012839 [Phrynocephalus forsythii]
MNPPCVAATAAIGNAMPTTIFRHTSPLHSLTVKPSGRPETGWDEQTDSCSPATTATAYSGRFNAEPEPSQTLGIQIGVPHQISCIPRAPQGLMYIDEQKFMNIILNK